MREKDNESTSLCIRADKVDRAERGDSETETERGKGVGEETEAEGCEGKKEKDMSGQVGAWERSDF